MNKHILTFGLILLTVTTSSQTIELNIHRKKLSDFVKIEQKSGSEQLENKLTYNSQKGIAQPLLFSHKEINLPDLITYYFFFQHDSAINYILYEWDAGYFNEEVKKFPEEINTFIGKYKKLHKQIFQTYGKSISKGDLTDLSKIETGNFKKEDTWKPNDSTEIELYTVLSGKYLQIGSMTINPAYRIRLYIRNRNKVGPAKKP